MEVVGIPGCAIGVLDGGDENVRGLGVTSVEHPLEVDGDTLFQTGSITKTFTGTVVMRLVEEGRLDLDAPVRAYVPELRLQDEDVAARVTNAPPADAHRRVGRRLLRRHRPRRRRAGADVRAARRAVAGDAARR